MTSLGDAAVARLRAVTEAPDLSQTRYELRELLGRGGMGAVYSVVDQDLKRLVALKVINTASVSPEMAERLRREARILAQLEHPNIIPVHDVGVLPDGRSFYTMKLVRGERLDAIVQRRLSLADRLQIFERICDALAFAHAHGVIHRDLKPANIMVGPFGEVLVLDWGVAKAGVESGAGGNTEDVAAPETGATGDGVIVGTQGFMSPEQARGDPLVDARTDIHALGVMLRYLLRSPSDAAASTHARPLRDQRVLLAIADRASLATADARYQSVAALTADVANYRNALPVEAYHENLAERVMRVAGRYRVPLVLIVAYVIMRLVLLIAQRY